MVRFTHLFPQVQTYKPDSVSPYDAVAPGQRRHLMVTSIISLHNALPQSVKPPTR